MGTALHVAIPEYGMASLIGASVAMILAMVLCLALAVVINHVQRLHKRVSDLEGHVKRLIEVGK